MRLLFSLLIFGLLTQTYPAFAQENGSVTLKGHLKNFNNQVQVEDMSEMKALLLPDPEKAFVPDTAGNFEISFPLASPNYFRLGRNILYLTPGDVLTINADHKDARLASFSGSHSSENEYLRETPYPKAGSFLEAGRNIKTTIDSTVNAILAEASKRTASLQKRKNSISGEFLRLETARIRADILNSFAGIRTYFPYMRRLSKDSAEKFQAGFENIIKPYRSPYEQNFLDPSLLKLAVYADIAGDLADHASQESPRKKQIRNWLDASQLAYKIKTASDRQVKLAFQPEIAAQSDPMYRKALEQTLENVLILSNGDPAVDFAARSAGDADVTLASLKGKLIYIDLWATWCGPCLQEMPALQKLKESYKDNDRIVFLSLSIDDDKAAWQKNLKQRNADGLQWVVDRATLKDYNIISIPRIIIVDQDFHVADLDAPTPSSRDVRNKLDSLLKIILHPEHAASRSGNKTAGKRIKKVEVISAYRKPQHMKDTSNHDDRIAAMSFASVYPHYITKVEKKGRTKEELHQVIEWLTGYNQKKLDELIRNKATFEAFFEEARLNPNAGLITGTICGYRVEEIKNPLTQQVRYLDKLVDELAKGRKMEKILRTE